MHIKESNRDLFPTDATLAMYAPVRPLLVNPLIDDAFLQHEVASVSAKRRYHILGWLSILLITFSAIYTIAEALIIPAFAGQRILSGLMGLCAAIGIGLQLYLLLTKQKNVWLLNRFACERLRSLKFQAFALAAGSRDTDELARAVEAFSAQELTKLDNELNAGVVLFEQFSPVSALSVPEAPKQALNADLVETVFGAFKELRISYQGRFAASEVHRMAGNQRYVASFSDMLYLAGAGFVLAALLFKLMAPEAETAGAWIDFLASTTFIAGIANTILSHSGISHHATTRFTAYNDGIKALPNTLTSKRSLHAIISEMELLALEELRGFCEDSNVISYRM